ncbi:hypothetical protein EC957_001030, partial [Mortierella hygrophila]
MYIAGSVKNHKFDILIDCGASANYINQEIVRALNIPTSKKKEALSVNGFNGDQIANCTRYCHIRLKLAPNFQPIIQFLVIPMKFDLVIGKRWLARSVPKPDLDLVHHTIRIGPETVIHGYVRPSHVPVLSAMQFKRCLNTDAAFLCLVKPNDEPSSKKPPVEQHPAAQALLKKYGPVFPDELPKVLPPTRAVDHKIEIIP